MQTIHSETQFLNFARWSSLMIAVALTFAACDRGAAGLALDKQAAKQTLVQFLDSWKAGVSIAEFRSTHPRVVASDLDWENGVQLTRYVLGDEKDDGTNLHVTVDLDVRDAQGGTGSQRIEYIIGTSPQVTIFRAY